MMLTVTIQTVADYAKVSRATVSRVLNDNPTVNSEIRDRVLEAVRILGYEPNRAARRLRKPSDDVIGVIISDIQNPYFTSVIRGIEDAAYSHNMNILLCNSDEDSGKFQKYLRVLQAESVAGLIVSPTSVERDRQALEDIQEKGVPIVLIDRGIESFDTIGVDNEDGGYLATNHMLQQGRRRIGIIYPDVSTCHARYRGYVRALTEADIALEPALIKIADYTAQSAYDYARELLHFIRPPDAIFSANDLVTLSVLRACREQKIKVPEDIAIVGFDDMPWSEELYTPLTVIAQPTYEIGKQAVQVLRHRLENGLAPAQTITLSTRLIMRQSSQAISERSATPR